MKSLTAAKRSAYRLGQSAEDPEFDESGTPYNPFTDTYEEPSRGEQILTGLIEGTVTNFGTTCKDGMTSTVHSLFRMWDNIEIYNPTKIMKFGMSTNNMIESTNVVFAYCDFSHVSMEI